LQLNSVLPSWEGRGRLQPGFQRRRAGIGYCSWGFSAGFLTIHGTPGILPYAVRNAEASLEEIPNPGLREAYTGNASFRQPYYTSGGFSS
jgi:hypothetical protein